MKNLFYSLLVLVFFIGCKEDDYNLSTPNNTLTENINNYDLGRIIQSNFFGKVIDEEGNPIVGARVTIGSQTRQTNTEGLYFFNDIPTREKLTLIKVEKNGYFKGLKTISKPQEGKANQQDIVLYKIRHKDIIATGNTSQVTDLEENFKLTFQGEFVKATGEDYHGNVNVFTRYVDPTSDNLIDEMPGNLLAFNSQNNLGALSTFGMVLVILEDEQGNELQLKTNFPATLEMRIQTEQINTAPNQIPLWYFDENVGVWIEEGAANKIGDTYIGEVSHFSWWNCDDFSEVILLNLKILDNNGNPIPSLQVPIRAETLGVYSNNAITNNQGFVSGYVPANTELTIDFDNTSISYYICDNGTMINVETVNFTDDINLGSFSQDYSTSITLTGPSINETVEGVSGSREIQGNFLNCNGEPIQEGYIHLIGLDQNIPIFNGEVNYTLPINCTQSTTLNYQVFDTTNQTGSDIIFYTYNYEEDVNFGTVNTCQDINLLFSLGFLDNSYKKLYFTDLHDEIGQKSKDLGTDLMTEDIVQTSHHWYGFYYSLENNLENYRSVNHFWNEVYFPIIHNSNNILNTINLETTDSNLQTIISQAYALRAFAYHQLIQLFQRAYATNSNLPGLPLYATERNIHQPSLNTISEVYDFIEYDYNKALQYGSNFNRAHKGEIDNSVVHGFLARIYLEKEDWQLAAQHANLAKQNFSLLTNAEYFTGFNNLNLNEMMWGTYFTPDNTLFYASYFSHMSSIDAGYAGALGLYKLIDKRLYDQIPTTDIRKMLFDNPNIDSPQYANTKFFSIGNNFLGDHIYMRASEMYLIEAEAKAKLGDINGARQILNQLLVNTQRDTNFVAANLQNELLEQIYLQRRIELWGEGFALNDLKRRNLGIDRNYVGTNHREDLRITLPSTSNRFIFQIPITEINNNPFINTGDQGF